MRIMVNTISMHCILNEMSVFEVLESLSHILLSDLLSDVKIYTKVTPKMYMAI